MYVEKTLKEMREKKKEEYNRWDVCANTTVTDDSKNC